MRSTHLVMILVAGLATTACESTRTLEVAVYEDASGDDGLIFHKEVWGEISVTPVEYRPVPNACVAVWDNAPDEDEPTRGCATAPSTAGHGRGRDWPVLLRSDAVGAAAYQELRIHVVPIVGTGVVRRHVVITAPGFTPRSFDVEISASARNTLVVPLTRTRISGAVPLPPSIDPDATP